MIRRLCWCILVLAAIAVSTFVLAVLPPGAGPAGAEQTGESCFHIANGSRGFAPGNGLDVTQIGATSAVLEITYVKTLACPLPGYIRYYWGPTYYDNQKADDVILTTAYEGFPVYSTGGDYVTKKITMTDIGTTMHRSIGYEVRPDTEIHVVVKLGYVGTTHLVRIGFHTSKDPAKNVKLTLDRVRNDSITVTPKLTASRFGTNTVGVDIKRGSGGWTGSYENQTCDAAECDRVHTITLTNGSKTITGYGIPRLEPNTTYTVRLAIHNYYSGLTFSDPLTVTTAK